METYHAVTDHDKVAQLAAIIDAGDWPGPPLVHDGDQLLTGTHRYAAARSIDMIDADIPLVDIREVFAEADMDWESVWHEHGEPTANEPYYVDAILELPPAIRRKYGIDME